MCPKRTVSAEDARGLLSYDAKSGKLYWKSEARCGFKKSVVMHRAGDEAGTARKSDGRIVIRLNGALYLRYRVAWLIENGAWPDGEIDHIDGNGTNDRISNLRIADRRTNQENRRRSQSGKQSSRYLGVYANKKGRSKPWRAAISSDGRQFYLGAFDNENDAHEAYLEAKRRLHDGCTI